MGGGGGGTPGNSWWGCAARFFKSSPDFRPKKCNYPHPFSDQTSKIHTHFQTSISGPGLNAEIMLSLLRLGRKYKNYSNLFGIRIFLFLSYSFGIETIKMFIHSIPRKPNPLPEQHGQSVYPFSDQNGAKALPDGAAHTYMAYVKEYPPRG